MRRLLVISKFLLDERDAQAQQATALIGGLANRGFRIDVITSEAAAPTPPIGTARIYALPSNDLYSRDHSLENRILRKVSRSLSGVWSDRWVTHASALASSLIAKHRYEALLSLALPIESHIAALRASRSIPWIASTSDPWPESLLPAPYSDYSSRAIDFFRRRLLSRILRTADRLAFTCVEQAVYLRRYFPQLASCRYTIIPHTPPSLFRRTDIERGLIVHAGSISRERAHPEILRALSLLPANSAVRLNLCGDVHSSLSNSARLESIGSRLTLSSWISKRDAQLLTARAHALLLIESEMSDYPFLPSKIADYASTGRPILAITGPNSPTARLLEAYGGGMHVTHKASEIARMLSIVDAQACPYDSSALHSYLARAPMMYDELISSI